MLKVRNCGVRCGVVLSTLVRQGISWRGNVLSGRARHGGVLYSLVRQSVILVWLGVVRSSPARLSNVRHGFSLRGLASYGTVLSCPVRYREALSGEAFRGMVWIGGAVSGPAGSSPAWFCKAFQGIFWRGSVGMGGERWTGVWPGMVRYCFGKVLRGIAWLREVLFRVVKFDPAKYSYPGYTEALLWPGKVQHSFAGRGGALYGMVRYAWALLRSGMVKCRTVGSGFARLGGVGQGLLLLRPAVVKQGSVMRAAVRCAIPRY
jgi:hypothetical protein